MMKRREFVKTCLKMGLYAGIADSLLPLIHTVSTGTEAGPATRSLLAVASGEPDAAAAKAIELLGGIDRFVASGNTVLLKPNVGFPNPPEWATTTHPALVEKVARLCIEAGAKRVLIADNPVRQADICFEKSQIGALGALSGKIHVIPLSHKRFFKKVKVEKGKDLKETDVAIETISADVIINLPIIKSHSATKISGSLKNLMGLVWNRRVFHEKMDLDQAIADLNTLIHPQLTVLDATRILLTRGPGGPGRIIKAGMVIAGADPLAVDSYAIGMQPWGKEELDPKSIPHLQKAWAMQLGNVEKERFEVKIAS
jgi:uncharacterized protein (DUF362 family)